MSLYLNKYVKETGLVLEPNYYPEMPQDDGIHGYTEVMPTESYVKTHFNEQTELYYEGATQEEIEEYTIENAVSVVSKRQLKLALILSGFDLSIIDNVIDNLTGLEKIIASTTWNEAITFERKDPLLVSLATAVGFSEIQLAELFNQASQL
jgi:hypothetical protein